MTIGVLAHRSLKVGHSSRRILRAWGQFMFGRYRSFLSITLAIFAIAFVTACSGGGGGSAPATPTPAISSFAPASAHVGEGVIISGIGFSGSTSVAFGGVPALVYGVDSDAMITATVPSGAVTGPITVSAPSGILTSSGSFTVLPPVPVISGFSPSPASIGDSVTISGQHFLGTTSVTVGGASISFVILSDTQIQITVPSSSWIGNNTVVVMTLSGTANSNPGLSVAYPALAVTGFTPSGGPSGTDVIITGQGFIGATSVTFNGLPSSIWTVNSATQITARVPPGTSTGLIRVTNATTADSAVQYLVTSSTTLDLTIDGAYISQSTQAYSGTVPLVQDRDGFLRVFPKANQATSAMPTVRIWAGW